MYMTKYRDSLETQSPEQHYRTRKQLETDAAKYARDTMVRDFVIGTAAIGGTILLGAELLTHKPSTALKAFRGELMKNLGETSINAAGHVIAYGSAFGEMAGNMAKKAAASAVTEASVHVGAATQAVAETAAKAVAERTQQRIVRPIVDAIDKATIPVRLRSANLQVRVWEGIGRIIGKPKSAA